jgi:hypothetical protein
MRRKLFTLAAGASEVVCFAAALVWPWSYRAAPNAVVGDPYKTWFAAGAYRGHGYLMRAVWDPRGAWRPNPSQPPVPPWRFRLVDPTKLEHEMSLWWGPVDQQDPRWGPERLGFVSGRPRTVFGKDDLRRLIITPLWLVFAVTFPLPSAWLYQWRRRRARQRLNHCRQCGYDLRATPDRCPECGTAVAGKGTGASPVS